MKIFIADKNKLFKFNLDFKDDNTCTLAYKPINYKEEILILFEKTNNEWYLKSSGSVNIIMNDVIAPSARVNEYNHYTMQLLDANIKFIIYFIPESETYEKYSLDQQQTILIGSSNQCHICYNNTSNIGSTAATIALTNNQFYINFSKDSIAYVNSEYCLSKKLDAGDIIFINGLKIIWMMTFIEINNPNQLVKITNLNKMIDNTTISAIKYTETTDEERNQKLYNNNELFYHMPRLIEIIEPAIIEIDSPPEGQISEKLPFILTIGTSLTMFASMFMMLWNIGSGMSSGQKSILNYIPQIVMCLAMLIGMIIIPKLMRNYQLKNEAKKEALRQEKYGEYLTKKEEEIVIVEKKQTSVLHSNAISIKECLDSINQKNRKFWERQKEEDDFISIRLGLGDIETKLTINAPEKHFSLYDDELLKKTISISENHKYLRDVPISLSLVENKIVSFVNNTSNNYNYMKDILIQLMALHSPEELKIVILTSQEKESFWNGIKYAPHCWSDDRSQRFFSTSEKDMQNVSTYLYDELKKRINKDASEQEKSDKKAEEKQIYKKYSKYYIIISDNYEMIKKSSVVAELRKYVMNNYGFSLLIFENSMKNLPPECECFVQIDEKNGAIIHKNIKNDTQLKFNLEANPQYNLNEYCVKLANTPIAISDGVSSLPGSLTFLEMFGVSRIEQLNISNRWKENNPVTSLATTIGVHADGQPFDLDLHEKFHGPHGLIAGSTGSGKSEFIITYILSLAVNYDPREVQFVLIDYKGGGLAGAFQNKEKNIHLPHLIGTITNLDKSEINRTLVSIESEMKRRQKVFNEVKEKLGESTIDIYKYQKFYRDGLVEKPMSHLFIISDEFAELKSQQPEFMAQLISTARIGRSLGIHLILATQKPSGVVNDQIWSNSKFKVCLKVQDRSDSMEVLKKPDAASIKEAGRFYLQVGYDDLYEQGQSGWSGAKYVPSNKIIRKIDESINIINNTGYELKNIKEIASTINVENIGDQLTNVVKYISDLGLKNNIKQNSLWLEQLNPIIYLSELKKKYNYKPTPYSLTPVIGEYDSPSTQSQNLYTLDLNTNGNTLIYGAAGSGKENLLTTLIWSLSTEHTPNEVNIYAIDLGAETLKIFHKFPHIGNIVTIDEPEKINDLYKMIEQEVEKRKELFVDYAGSYAEYIKSDNPKLPQIIIVLNGYETFAESFYKLSESVMPIYRDCYKYGIKFIVSTIGTNSIRNRMAQSFSNKICLQLSDSADYRAILNSARGLTPAKYFGRGIATIDESTYEFQTALFVERSQINNVVKQAGEKLQDAYKTRAYKIPSIPEVVYLEKILNEVNTLSNVPLGYNMETKELLKYNFKDKITAILSNDMDDRKISFAYAIVKMLSKIQNTKVRVLDFVKAYERDIDNVISYRNNFDEAIIEINNEIMRSKEDNSTYMYVVLGIGDYKTRLSSSGIEVFNHALNSLENFDKCHIVIVDLYASFRTLQNEQWYQNNFNSKNGIWLGPEISSQLALNILDLEIHERALNFPDMSFVLNNGKHKVIKCVVDMEEPIE